MEVLANIFNDILLIIKFLGISLLGILSFIVILQFKSWNVIKIFRNLVESFVKIKDVVNYLFLKI